MQLEAHDVRTISAAGHPGLSTRQYRCRWDQAPDCSGAGSAQRLGRIERHQLTGTTSYNSIGPHTTKTGSTEQATVSKQASGSELRPFVPLQRLNDCYGVTICYGCTTVRSGRDDRAGRNSRDETHRSADGVMQFTACACHTAQVTAGAHCTYCM